MGNFDGHVIYAAPVSLANKNRESVGTVLNTGTPIPAMRIKRAGNGTISYRNMQLHNILNQYH